MCNVGQVDRVVRFLFSIVMIGCALYFVPTALPKTLLLVSGVLVLTSAWSGVCLVYKTFGISTAKPHPAPHTSA